MNTELSPAMLALEYIRREAEELTPAQFLIRLRQLQLEFADLLELTHIELREEISFASEYGVH